MTGNWKQEEEARAAWMQEEEEMRQANEEAHIRWHTKDIRADYRAEVNKLLTAVFENESHIKRRLIIISLLAERAADLRDKVLDEYIESEGMVIQTWQLDHVAELSGLSMQTIRARERRVRHRHWEAQRLAQVKEEGCDCEPTVEWTKRPASRLDGNSRRKWVSVMSFFHVRTCPLYTEPKKEKE